MRNQIREALTVRVPPTPDSAGIEKCLLEELAGTKLTMPRGFKPALQEGLRSLSYDPVEYNYTRKGTPGLIAKPKYSLRPHQGEAVRAIILQGEGVVVAPPAAGKTIIALAAIERLGERAIIIVDRENLLDQWSSRCEEFLGHTPFLVGGGRLFVKTELAQAKIVIAMQQTLAQESAVFSPAFYDSFGVAVLDECHHVSADTYTHVFEKFTARTRIGLSATPYRNDGLDLISKLVIGPVIYEVDEATLEAAKYIIRPSVEIINTGFEHDFWGTHRVSKHEICDKPKCPKNGTSHSHRNNYMNVTKALVEDSYRNYIIAKKIYQNIDKCNMVVSDRLVHLATLREMTIELGFPEDRTYMLTGKENAKQRAEVTRMAGYGACAIFSTIAKEALDIPRLDRLHLTWPIKKEHILKQQIGRTTRTHPDKADAVCYDYVDELCSVLANQAAGRFRYYHQQNYDIKQ